MARDEADADAVALHKAMKGFGTDDAALMDILVDRSPAEVQRISESFRNKFGSKGDLAAWIADDTSGNYKDVLLALGTPPSCRPPSVGAGDAHPARFACLGLPRGPCSGPRDAVRQYAGRRTQVIAGGRRAAPPAQPAEPRALPGTRAQRLSASATPVFYAKQRNCRRVPRFCTQAILRDRNDPLNIAYDLEKELDDEFATPALDEVKAAFEGLHGQSLEDAVRGATSGRSQEVLLLLLEDPATRDAKELREAILSKLEYKVIELLVLRSPRERAGTPRRT